MSGSSDYRERKCSEYNNGNIFKEIIFNGEVQVIKVFHLLRACDTNQKPNRLKVKIPFEVDLKRFLPSFANTNYSIYILFAAINFYGPTVTSGFAIYLQKTMQSYMTTKQLQRKQRKQFWGPIISRECIHLFLYPTKCFSEKNI